MCSSDLTSDILKQIEKSAEVLSENNNIGYITSLARTKKEISVNGEKIKQIDLLKKILTILDNANNSDEYKKELYELLESYKKKYKDISNKQGYLATMLYNEYQQMQDNAERDRNVFEKLNDKIRNIKIEEI